MNFAEFWQLNNAAFFDNAVAYCVRYQGTLEDFEAQRNLIEDFARQHFTRHKATLVDLTAYEGDGTFLVFAWGTPH